MMVKAVLGAVVLALLCSCTTLTEEEQDRREYKRQIDLQNWALCERVYKEAGVVTFHYGHTHERRVDSDAVKSDLLVNRCKSILKGYWAHY